MTTYEPLRQQLAGPDIVVAPGCYDAYSALLVAKAGFNVAYISGASIAFTRIGRPDIGLISMHEVAQTVSSIAEYNEIPLVIDGDTLVQPLTGNGRSPWSTGLGSVPLLRPREAIALDKQHAYAAADGILRSFRRSTSSAPITFTAAQ